MLKIDDLRVNYGGIEAVKGITLAVPEREIVTLIGANGAGKSTTLRVCVWGAVVSALLYCFCTKVLGYGWRYERRAVKKLGPGLRYLGYLIVEMLKAGLVVMKLVYTRGRNMKPLLVFYDSPVHTEGGRAVLANSITLTAGTITVETVDGRFCVHALDRSLAEGIEDCEFQRRLEKLEE